ncbi:MAG: TrbI/VirB10 family protein [Formosimonas sp.]
MSTNNTTPDLNDPFGAHAAPVVENTVVQGSVDAEPVASQSVTHNPYLENHTQRQEASLDGGAPKLADPRGRGVNKKAMTFMVVGGGALALLTALAIGSVFGGKKTEAPSEERVPIPEAPSEPVAPAAGMPAAGAAIDPNAKPIEVVDNKPAAPIDEPMPPAQPAPPAVQPAQPVLPPPDPIVERRKESGGLVDGGGAEAESVAGGAIDKGSVAMMKNRDFMLVRGTYIRCILETRIITDVPGFASCVTTEPVYSVNAKKLLLPKGSKVSGKFNDSGPTGPRINVVWDRILTPNGYDVRLKSPGVDALGGAGHLGDFRSHWASRIASAVLVSMVADAFKYAGAKYGEASTTLTAENGSKQTNPYDSATSKTIQDVAKDQISRYGARPSTVTINQGTLINIYTARDIDFSSVIRN